MNQGATQVRAVAQGNPRLHVYYLDARLNETWPSQTRMHEGRSSHALSRASVWEGGACMWDWRP